MLLPGETHTEALFEVDGHVFLRGRNADGSFGPIHAVRIADTGMDVNAFCDSTDNLNWSYKERVQAKTKPVTITADDKKRIAAAVSHLKKEVFTHKAMLEVVQKRPVLEAFKSGKWSDARFENGINDLFAECNFNVKYCASVKNEAIPVPKGGKLKSPRMILSSGDAGQLMALLSIAVLEKTLFTYFEANSIKGRPKSVALREVFASMRSKDGSRVLLVEGDGSAWDTTCSALMRALVENPIIRHVCDFLSGLGICPDAWTNANLASHDRRTERITKKVKGPPAKRLLKNFKATIAAFRPSGHRGTSVLNYLMNIVLWSVAVAEHPGEFLTKGRYAFEPRFGKVVVDGKVLSWKGAKAMEGDDSLLRLPYESKKCQQEIEDFWSRCGFNMKLFFRQEGEVAEFCGTHAYVEDLGAGSEYRPDLMRAVASCAWTTSPEAIRLANEGKYNEAGLTARRIAVGAFLCRADAFAGKDDRAAALFLGLARGAYKGAEGTTIQHLDREAIIRLEDGDVDAASAGVDAVFVEVAAKIDWGNPNRCRNMDRVQKIEWDPACVMGAKEAFPYNSDVRAFLPRVA